MAYRCAACGLELAGTNTTNCLRCEGRDTIRETMTFAEYQDLVGRTMNSKLFNRAMEIATKLEGEDREFMTRFVDAMPYANYGMGMAGEAGEASDLLKKIVFHGHAMDKEKVIKEIGDVLWYIAATATKLGVSLEEVAIRNIEKLRARYPEGFSTDRSVNRVLDS
jgi:NTP pyrophosphatase (non-canonical NTP hydrolase)